MGALVVQPKLRAIQLQVLQFLLAPVGRSPQLSADQLGVVVLGQDVAGGLAHLVVRPSELRSEGGFVLRLGGFGFGQLGPEGGQALHCPRVGRAGAFVISLACAAKAQARIVGSLALCSLAASATVVRTASRSTVTICSSVN